VPTISRARFCQPKCDFVNQGPFFQLVRLPMICVKGTNHRFNYYHLKRVRRHLRKFSLGSKWSAMESNASTHSYQGFRRPGLHLLLSNGAIATNQHIVVEGMRPQFARARTPRRRPLRRRHCEYVLWSNWTEEMESVTLCGGGTTHTVLNWPGLARERQALTPK